MLLEGLARLLAVDRDDDEERQEQGADGAQNPDNVRLGGQKVTSQTVSTPPGGVRGLFKRWSSVISRDSIPPSSYYRV